MESHRSSIQNMLRWTKDDAALLAMTNEVDYDQDGKSFFMIHLYFFPNSIEKYYFFTFPSFFAAFCQQLEDMITEKIEAFQELREKARNFRTCLRDEEAKSRLLMHRN